MDTLHAVSNCFERNACAWNGSRWGATEQGTMSGKILIGWESNVYTNKNGSPINQNINVLRMCYRCSMHELISARTSVSNIVYTVYHINRIIVIIIVYTIGTSRSHTRILYCVYKMELIEWKQTHTQRTHTIHLPHRITIDSQTHIKYTFFVIAFHCSFSEQTTYDTPYTSHLVFRWKLNRTFLSTDAINSKQLDSTNVTW